jgi:hypothetical protein
MSNEKAISNFMYFGFNFPYNFIQEVWEDDQVLISHLEEKFDHHARMHSSTAFFSWFMELSSANKSKLMGWVEANYEN